MPRPQHGGPPGSSEVESWGRICGEYLTSRRHILIDAIVQHLRLTAVSVLIGLALSLPLAVLARRGGWAVGPVLYSLTLLVRNILACLRAAPEETRQAARGMGYGPIRLLLTVELLLALPAAMAGLRIAMVSAISLVTVVNRSRAGGAGVTKALGELNHVLTTADLASKNEQVDSWRRLASDVARTYLEDKGLLKQGGQAPA
ncbi:hypothetical protein ABZ848_08550 [Streptomyces sp. NPDC047081]|uniref:hypothetical protein n=1 Tax=Streptomyces sp. NPDC047081 TaxID=3154706 RepID=UPI0033F30719